MSNQITAAKVAGACCFMRLVLSRFPNSRSGAYRHFAEFFRYVTSIETLHVGTCAPGRWFVEGRQRETVTTPSQPVLRLGFATAVSPKLELLE
jgi:hypothetical protein